MMKLTMRRKIALLIFLTMFAMLSCSSFSPKAQDPSLGREEQGQQDAGAKTNQIGDIVDKDGLTLIVLGWEYLLGNENFQPESGYKFVAVEFIVINTSPTERFVDSGSRMRLDSNPSTMGTTSSYANALVDSTVYEKLNPGEKGRGKIGFEIPENAKDLKFVLLDESLEKEVMVFDLGPRPIKIEPPRTIAGETPQKTYKVGDIVEIGTLAFSVTGATNPVEDMNHSKPLAGYAFLSVAFTIENKGVDVISIDTFRQMSIKISTGQSYREYLWLDSNGGDLAPGGKIAGQAGFQVPANATGLVFIFRDKHDPYPANKILIALP